MGKSLFSLMRPVIFYILTALFTGFLCNMSVVGLMAASAYLVTSAALKTPLYLLSLSITGVRLFGISRAVFRYAERYISHNAAFAVWRNLRITIYKNVLRALPFSNTILHSGDIYMAVIESLDALRDAVLRLILPPLAGLLMAVALFFFILPWNVLSAVIFAVAFSIIVILLPILFYPHKRDTMPVLETELYEFINGAKEIAAFGYEENRARLAYDKIDSAANAEIKLFKFTTLAETAAQVTAAAAIVALLAIFIDMAEYITAVNAAVLLLAATAAFEILIPLAGLGGQLQIAVKAAHDLGVLLVPHTNTLPQAPQSILSEENLLTVKNLSFAYEKNPPLYDNLSFELKKGEKTALIGTSGSGKSTIVNLLIRLLAYNSGGIFLQDKAYSELTEEKIRESIKTSLQNQYIFAMTIKENF